MAFPTTRWTLLAEATLNGDASGRASLARFCEQYRRPVVAYLRARGLGPEEVEDVAQDFFLKLLEARVWKRADPARGRFRTFMLAVLNHLLLHRARHESRQKRGGNVETDSLDWLSAEGWEVAMQAPIDSAAFDREWALTLVSEAIASVAAAFQKPRGQVEFTMLRRFLPGPAAPPSYAEAATELGMSETALRTAVSRLRTKFREVLREAVSRTVTAPHEVDDELRYLAALLMKQDTHLQQSGTNGKESST